MFMSLQPLRNVAWDVIRRFFFDFDYGLLSVLLYNLFLIPLVNVSDRDILLRNAHHRVSS